ncbi:putative uncharacterized protein ENSP00000383309 [Penaeus chinensis]|uniref:putative uncharacterized protein ENSP00000383309 n=1 Tax=Penaeus chinensis TaxID=139456 RepID=UPI001FB699A4|nr:putative uncharacterized protein ENSP00000383309 [Penaeus chinensis]
MEDRLYAEIESEDTKERNDYLVSVVQVLSDTSKTNLTHSSHYLYPTKIMIPALHDTQASYPPTTTLRSPPSQIPSPTPTAAHYCTSTPPTAARLQRVPIPPTVVHLHGTSSAPTATPLQRTPTEAHLQGTPTEAPFKRIPTEAPLQRTPTAAPLQRTPTAAPLQRTPTEAHLQRTPTAAHLQRTPTAAPLQRTPTEAHLQRTPTAAHLQRTPTAAHLQRTPTAAHLQRTPTAAHLHPSLSPPPRSSCHRSVPLTAGPPVTSFAAQGTEIAERRMKEHPVGVSDLRDSVIQQEDGNPPARCRSYCCVSRDYTVQRHPGRLSEAGLISGYLREGVLQVFRERTRGRVVG